MRNDDGTSLTQAMVTLLAGAVIIFVGTQVLLPNIEQSIDNSTINNQVALAADNSNFTSTVTAINANIVSGFQWLGVIIALVGAAMLIIPVINILCPDGYVTTYAPPTNNYSNAPITMPVIEPANPKTPEPVHNTDDRWATLDVAMEKDIEDS